MARRPLSLRPSLRATRRLPLLALAGLSLGLAACSSEGDPAGTGGGGGSTSPSAGGGSPTSAQGGGASGDGGSSAVGQGGAGQGGAGQGGGSTAVTTGAGGGGPCPAGVTCVDGFPFSDERDTALEGAQAIDAYTPCAPDTNEGGPEIVYRVWAPSDGLLSAVVVDGAGVDIDVQILTDFDPAAPSGATCVARGDLQAAADVAAGPVWVVADTYVSGAGPQTGAFRIDIGFVGPSEGPCAMRSGSMDRVGDDAPLAMPATGPVSVAPHLVTQEEPAPFPTTADEELDAHYALSQHRTGMVMMREQPWAPLDGGSFYGAGIGDPAEVPVEGEAWYVTMLWTPASRPPQGARMILRSPDDPTRAVVVAAGYETGPGNLSSIGAAPEETHFYLGTEAGASLTLGVAEDQSLPLGPRRCTD